LPAKAVINKITAITTNGNKFKIIATPPVKVNRLDRLAIFVEVKAEIRIVKHQFLIWLEGSGIEPEGEQINKNIKVIK